jgi:predicted O-linked N-acetylglucosamine transferase (SPINDLY family)
MAWMSVFERLAQSFNKKDSDEVFATQLELLSDPQICCQQGERLLKQQKPEIALQFFQKAVALDSKSARGWFGQGMALSDQGEYAESLEYFRKVIELDPGLAIAHANLARSLHELGQADLAYQGFKQALGLNFTPVLQNVAVTIPGIPSASNQTVLLERKKWADEISRSAGSRSSDYAVNTDKNKQCLKIGYVSAFFHKQNWMKPVWALVVQHDREKFQIHLFSDRTKLTPEIDRFLKPDDRFHDMSDLSNEQAADLINKLQIDILVDLNGYSYPPRFPIFLRRPAALIVGWFNMYATTGFDCFDYLVGDDCVIPREEEKFYCEKIVRVPGSYLTFNVDYHVPEVQPPPCLSNGFVTFGSLISQYKITGKVIDAWSKILHETPDSRLLIRNACLGKDSNRKFLQSQFEQQEISSERISMQGPAAHFEFLETYDRIDIALDAFPYNGGTTTTEAIWQGVPVVAYWGDRWVSRTSATLLRAASLGELVANDVSAYVHLATQLAGDHEKLKMMRLTMRENLLGSKACDTVGLARSMETLYRKIWQNQ